MEEFVVETIDPEARLVFSNRQIAPITEFVWGFDCQLLLPGLSPVTTSAVRSDEFHTFEGITDFFRKMNEDWLGWPKPRLWCDQWKNLSFECRNSGQRYMDMTVALRPSSVFEPVTEWKVTAELHIELNQLDRLARHAVSFFGIHPS